MDVNGGTRQITLSVSLRGTLADEYVHRHKQDPQMATVWLRKVCKEATSQTNHPTFLVRMEAPSGKMIIGKRLEVGMYPPDW